MKGSKKSPASRAAVRLAPGIRLDGARGDAMHLLVRPEGKVQLNQTAATILQLCDGSRNREEIVAEVVRRSPKQMRATEIVEFLDAARARGWISEN